MAKNMRDFWDDNNIPGNRHLLILLVEAVRNLEEAGGKSMKPRHSKPKSEPREPRDETPPPPTNEGLGDGQWVPVSILVMVILGFFIAYKSNIFTPKMNP
ncbi:hypothetical protein MKW98_030654 [Papaver atlanticum]|uniref:Uncharacterized protein n=1 Tax=Papaver atlanticum TaxID=357466 RepID=A0AAD4RUC1_9MAGN|nr:hypothetical protein MKW98_030654 [Papaver atlanticum]